MAGGVIMPLHGGGMLSNISTLAEELRGVGYSTQAVGKWHLGFCHKDYLPTSRGFDHHYGYWTGSQDYYKHINQNFGGYDFRDDLAVDYGAKGVYSSVLYEKRAVQLIESHDQSKPLFLYLAFQSPHSPLQAPEKYIKMYDDVEDKDRRVYLGMVTAMDDAVGGIIASLKRRKMFENTIIVFLSDNGGEVLKGASNWPLRGKKGRLWEGGTRTPAFIHGPGLHRRVEQNMFHVTDWYPTIMEMINKNHKGPSMDGISAWKALSEKSHNWKRNEVVYNIRQAPMYPFNPTAAIRIGDWKYIWSLDDDSASWEIPLKNGTRLFSRTKPRNFTNLLFNLSEDPQEKIDLSSIDTSRALKMHARLNTLMKNSMYLKMPNMPAGDPKKHGGLWSTGWC